MRLVERVKRLYEKYLKHHCPECGGIMDGDQLDMTLDKVVYACRNCGKEWI